MTAVDLNAYDWVLINSSAGKDSQTMLREVVRLADAQGCPRAKLVVVHANLGRRVEWDGTQELAAEQAAHYGLAFRVVTHPKGDLLDYVRRRAATLAAKGSTASPWPSSGCRWCTSDLKRGPVAKVMTELAARTRAAEGSRPARILNCLGMRAGESVGRSKLVPFKRDDKQSNTRREVTAWLPIFDWTAERVWADVRASGVRHHPAYDLGMPRLSCALCIYAPKSALMLAGKHNRAKLDA
jgi:3'-phosphoadenosine 5'-phosphosulfate sulfotransferase (PAPS reductase)/FAD synthetase